MTAAVTCSGSVLIASKFFLQPEDRTITVAAEDMRNNLLFIVDKFDLDKQIRSSHVR